MNGYPDILPLDMLDGKYCAVLDLLEKNYVLQYPRYFSEAKNLRKWRRQLYLMSFNGSKFGTPEEIIKLIH